MTPNRFRQIVLALFAVFVSDHSMVGVDAFGGLESIPSHLVQDVGALSVAAKTSFQDVQTLIASSTTMSRAITSTPNLSFTAPSPLVTFGTSLLQEYKQLLATHPLTTKMVTGGTLAVCGDAIAQSREVDKEYDSSRAASFFVFDMCYRALQHVSFPIIVNHCHGQYLGGLAALLMMNSGSATTEFAAAMEQTLASQLGIVPFLYYPVFFTLTGYMQGLNMEGSIDRAKENFLPLMKRNLLFWIPVQFVQFGFIEEGLQIPFLSVCGLAWTFILSVAAGSAKKYSDEDQQDAIPAPFDEQEVIAKMNGQGYVTVPDGAKNTRQKAFGLQANGYERQMDSLMNESMEKAATK